MISEMARAEEIARNGVSGHHHQRGSRSPGGQSEGGGGRKVDEKWDSIAIAICDLRLPNADHVRLRKMTGIVWCSRL